MHKYITLASQAIKALSSQNSRLLYQFCTADAINKQQYFQQFHNKNVLRNQQNFKSEKNSNQKTQRQQFQPEKPIETYCKELLENNNKRLSELTNRRELNNYRILARKTKFDYFNFVIAKCYLNNSKYFQEFFIEQDISGLLREYSVNQFQSFFNNFILVSVVLDSLGDTNKIVFNKLYNSYIQQRDQLKELGEDQLIVYQMYILLRFLNQNDKQNEQYNNYIQNFVPQYLDKVLEEIKFNQKTNLTKYDMQFAVNYIPLKFSNNIYDQFTFLQDMFCKLNTSQDEQFTVEFAQEFIKIFITLMNQSEDMIVQNFKSFSPILEKSLMVLQNTSLDASDIVQFYYVISRTELVIENKKQTINLLKQLEQLLIKDNKFSLIQRKSLFYSIGKNSYLSEGISQFLDRNLSTINLQGLAKKDKFDQYLTNLILSSVNLGVLTKDNITHELLQIIFKCASNIQNIQKQQKLLTTIAISLYRARYFSIEFWQPFLEKLDLSKQTYFVDVIMRTFKTFSSEMEPEVYSLLEQKADKYISIQQSNPKENAEHTACDEKLKSYLEKNNITYKQSVYIDEQYSNFLVNENTCVLILNLNNYIITENIDTQVLQFNVSTKFKVEYLEKKGYKVIVINTYDDEAADQFSKKFSNQN